MFSIKSCPFIQIKSTLLFSLKSVFLMKIIVFYVTYLICFFDAFILIEQGWIRFVLVLMVISNACAKLQTCHNVGRTNSVGTNFQCVINKETSVNHWNVVARKHLLNVTSWRKVKEEIWLLRRQNFSSILLSWGNSCFAAQHIWDGPL